MNTKMIGIIFLSSFAFLKYDFPPFIHTQIFQGKQPL